MTRHRPRLARLDICPCPFNSTSTRTCLARHRPWPARLDIGLGPHDSTSPWPGCLDNDSGPLDLIDLTQHGPGPTRLDSTLACANLLNISPDRLGSTQYRPLSSTWPKVDSIQLGNGRLISLWTWVDFAQLGPELSWFNLDWTKLKSNPKCNLDNPKMYPIYM